MSSVRITARILSLVARLLGRPSGADAEILGRFVRNSSFQLTTSLVSTGAAFLQTLLLARYLGVEGYGLLALLMTYFQFVGQFVSFNMWEVVTKYGAEFMVAGKRKELLAATKLGYAAEVVAGALTGLICVWGSTLAVDAFFHAPTATSLIVAYAPIILFTFIDNTSNAILRIHAQFKIMALRDITFAFFRLASLVGVLLVSPGLRQVITVLLLNALALTLLNVVLSFRLLSCSPQEFYRARLTMLLPHRRALLSFVVNNYFSQCWSMIIGSADVLFLGYFRNPGEVGLYRMGKNFFNLLMRLVEPFYMVIYPDLAKLWASMHYSSFLGLVKRSSILVAAIVTPLALSVIILIPYVLKYAVGSEFLDAVEPTRILICGAWVAAVFFWTRPAVLAMDKAHIPAIINFFNMLLVLGLSVLMVPWYGVVGTALVYGIPILFGNLLVGFCVYRTYRFVTA